MSSTDSSKLKKTPAKKTPAKKTSTKKTSAKKTTRKPYTNTEIVYDEKYCQDLLKFFDVPAFKITEVMKKDGSISLIETASELPTFAAFARSLGVTQEVLMRWDAQHPCFHEAAQKARDLQCDILVQNSLRGNYASSFAMFTAKNILGWNDGNKPEKPEEKKLTIRWED